MFFAASDKFGYVLDDKKFHILIIRMRNVPAIDSTGVEELKNIVKRCEKRGIKVIFSHVNEQPMRAMTKAGFTERVGMDNFCDHIDTALLRAEALESSIAAAKN